MTPAARQRLYRKRDCNGERVFPVVVGGRVIEALLASGRLTDKASRNRKKVSQQLAAVLAAWAGRWLK